MKFLSKGTQKSLTPEQKESGAGLGLVTALKNANKLVFNLAPGSGTEVIALFDLDLLAKGRPGVRAVHIFTERRKVAPPAASNEPTPSLRPSMAPLIAGALAIVLIVFGVVGVVRKLQEPPPPDVKAEITVGDGESRDVPVHIGISDVKLKVERKGSNFVITSENAWRRNRRERGDRSRARLSAAMSFSVGSRRSAEAGRRSIRITRDVSFRTLVLRRGTRTGRVGSSSRRRNPSSRRIGPPRESLLAVHRLCRGKCERGHRISGDLPRRRAARRGCGTTRV